MSDGDFQNNGREQDARDGELFAIIDETGEGFGFEMTPEALAKPLAIGASALFSLGMLAGIPFGLVMGRSQEGDGKGFKAGKARPSLDGLKFAATTFGLGSLLCGSMGVVGFYGIKRYYNVETFEEFGNVMKQTVPIRRREMETGLKPVLDRVRQNAGDSLPGPMRRMQERFLGSRFGNWIKEQVDFSVVITDDEPEGVKTLDELPDNQDRLAEPQ